MEQTLKEKADQVVDLAGSTLDWARLNKDADQHVAVNAAAAGKLYITLAGMLQSDVPRRRWVAPALRTADMHNAQAGLAPCAELVLALLYGQR